RPAADRHRGHARCRHGRCAALVSGAALRSRQRHADRDRRFRCQCRRSRDPGPLRQSAARARPSPAGPGQGRSRAEGQDGSSARSGAVRTRHRVAPWPSARRTGHDRQPPHESAAPDRLWRDQPALPADEPQGRSGVPGRGLRHQRRIPHRAHHQSGGRYGGRW
ncbi:hypothetical protein OY671_011329, partial [Metschnikowia pulcherrima]